MENISVGVVIPAAGRSERFSGRCPKQYIPIMGKPLFMHTVDAFLPLPYISKICLVTDNDDVVRSQLTEFGYLTDKITIASGGSSRHLSIKNGVEELVACDLGINVVVVHDGARPIVPLNLLEQLVIEAFIHGAAGATRPLTSTVLRPGLDGFLEESLDRNTYVASETPQAFQLALISSAYEMCSPDDLHFGTECLHLVFKYCGVRAKLIHSNDSLWKVTEKKDLFTARGCIKERSTRVCILAEKHEDFSNTLLKLLHEEVAEVRCYTTDIGDYLRHKYNTVICIHYSTYSEETFRKQIDITLDPKTQGLIIHLIYGIQSQSPNDHFSSMREKQRSVLQFPQQQHKGNEYGTDQTYDLY